MMKKIAQIQVLSTEAMMLQMEVMSKGFRPSQHEEKVMTEYFSFESLKGLFSELGLSCWRLLEHLLQHKQYNSLKGLAEDLEYSSLELTQDIDKLMILGLLERDTNGKVYVPFDDIQLNFSLSTKKSKPATLY